MSSRISRPAVRRRAFMAAFVAIPLAAALGAAAADLVSARPQTPIVVDGLPDEWPSLTDVDRSLRAAVANDDEFLYVTVATDDPSLRGALSTGVVLWIDPRGRRNQTFGIWMAGIEAPLLPGMEPDSPRPSSGRSSMILSQFDLLGPNKNQRRLIDLTPESGMALATGTEDALLAYEARVPLALTPLRRYAANVEPGATIGLGIATPDVPRERRRRPTLVGSGGMIGGNPYLGGANGGGFADFGEPDDRPKPLSVWTTVQLAR